MNIDSELGQLIKSLRSLQNLTLHQVAKDTDIDMTMLSKIERGERLPTFEQVRKIAIFFQKDENELITKLTAEKIVKEYGISEITLNAVQLVEEQIMNHLNKSK